MIKVSVIIPVYNAARYIESCIDSVMAQIYTNIECIIIDDCSSDQSIALINDKLQDYNGDILFKLLVQERNLVVGAARNLGTRKATGDYIYFLDGDDIIYPQCISALVGLADRYRGVDLVMGDMKCENEEKNNVLSIGNKPFPQYSEDPCWIHSVFLMDVPVSPCNKLIRLALIKNNELYFAEQVFHEDVLWLFFLSKPLRSIAFYPYETYYYNQNNVSITTNPANEEKRIESWDIVFDIYLKHIDNDVKWIENLSVLKLFRHVRLLDISTEFKALFDKKIVRRLRKQMRNPDLPLVFKPMYATLLFPTSFIRTTEFLWNKCLGMLYGLSKRRDREQVIKAKSKNTKILNLIE